MADPLIVVKIGGTEGVDFSAICEDVAEMSQNGQKIILVHGGSAEANALGSALNHPPRFITTPSGFTSRYTDRKTLEIFMMAVNGKVNSLLVEQLQAKGVNAFGLSGVDGRVLVASRKETIRAVENGKQKLFRDDFTGKIEQVNVDLLQYLLTEGYTPVIAPMAVSPSGEALNVDADRAAAIVASALKSETLVMLTGAPGLLRAFPDESSLISTLAANQLEAALSYAQGRMKKKVLGAQEAVFGGVKKVVIADGRIQHPVNGAIAGKGTIIHA